MKLGRHFLLCGKKCLLLLALLSFPIISVPGVSAQQAAAHQETTGLPWTGEKGVHQTMSSIMARQQQEDLLAKGKPKKFRLKKEKENPDHDHLPQDPNSPNVARWVPSQGVADNVVTSLAPLAPQSLSTSFTGATLADTGAFPPDSMGAVGPSQFVVFVNGRLRTFNKTTGVADAVLNVNPDVFFSSVMTTVTNAGGLNFTSDPQVRYDRLSGRWILAIIDVPSTSSASIGDLPNRWLLAVSDSASANALSPSTVWTFYFVQQNTVGGGNTGEFLDYDSLGVDANALYVGGNMFSASSGAFADCSAFVIRKSSVLNGGPLVVTAFRGIVANSAAEGPFAPRGVDNYDPNSNEGYLIGNSDAATGRLVLRRVSNPGGTPAISANILITVSTTSSPIPVQHLGNTGASNGRLDALDNRLFAAHIRNGRLWTAHNIGTTGTGVAGGNMTSKRTSIRWYELNVPVGAGTPTVVQSGTIFDSASGVSTARQYWMPSVMVSGQGHAAFGFSTAGTPYRANAATTGRLASDTLGTLQAFTNYTASSTAYNPPSDPGGTEGRRWGDYSFTSLDPNDDMTMWTIQEFCDNTDSYGVRVIKLLAPPPAIPITCSPSVVTQGVSNVAIVVSGLASNGSGFFDPGTNFLNHIAAVVNGGSVTVNSVTYNNPTNITLNLSVDSDATTTTRTITVTNPDGQSATSVSGILAIAGLPASSFTLTVNQIGAGTGIVTSLPSGIDCGSTCSVSFASNTVVMLTATADSNSAFLGWVNGCVGTGTCQVTISSNITLTANFDALPVISAASVLPGSPTTTNDLVASVTSSNDADGDPIIFTYQWQQSTDSTNFANVAFTSDTLPASATTAGDYYRVLITPNDGFADGQTFTTAAVFVPADADGNGINDDWEVQYFGQMGIDPNADPDGDGFSNLQEFLAGTDPTDSGSALRITEITINDPDVVVSFTSCTNKLYDLQFSDDLMTTNWTATVTNIPGTATITSATDPGAVSLTNRFYRVRLLP